MKNDLLDKRELTFRRPGPILGTIFILCLTKVATGQSLDFTSPTETIPKQRFDIEMSQYWASKIAIISGEKLEIPRPRVSYNNQSLAVETIKTRGNSTLYFKRKSLLLSFENRLNIEGFNVKKLALNNLTMDQNYYRNRLSFLMMEKLGLFHLAHQFAEVRINGKTQGIYLALQKADDYAKGLKSDLLVRREYGGQLEIEELEDKGAKVALKKLRRLRRLSKKYEGKQLFDSLNSVVHINRYFRWLAFNKLILNGDYTDELYLFLHPEDNRFDIIPWDYDDIFRNEPHEGIQKRDRTLEHELLFSSEAYIDVLIDQDEYLYTRYLDNFRVVLNTLKPGVIQQIFEQVYRELHPYYADDDIIRQSQFDQYGQTDLTMLQQDMQRQFLALVGRRQSIAATIDRVGR